MKKIILIMLLALLNIHSVSELYSQSATKKAAKEVAEKALVKKAIKKGAQKYARKKLGSKVAEQASLRIARHKVTSIMEKEGIKTFKKLNKKVLSQKLKISPIKGRIIYKGHVAAKSYLKKSYKKSLQLKNKGFRIYRNTSITGRPSSVRSVISKNHQTVSAYKYEKIMRNPQKRDRIMKNFGNQKSAKVLRDNMNIAMGAEAKYVPNSKNNAAHHLVGGGGSSEPARFKLEKYGIDINDPRNGIFLPSDEKSVLKGPVHTGKHTDNYFKAVNEEFKNCKSQLDCINALERVKQKLLDGDLVLYNSPAYNL